MGLVFPFLSLMIFFLLARSHNNFVPVSLVKQDVSSLAAEHAMYFYAPLVSPSVEVLHPDNQKRWDEGKSATVSQDL